MTTKTLLVVIIILAVVGGGVLWVSNSASPAPASNLANQFEATGTPPTTYGTTPTQGSGVYTPYSKSTYDAASRKKRVFFFHASWCPTCKAAHEEFTSQSGRIPPDVVLLKTDYDKETALKQKYGITYQHTFVLVDENGNETKKWNGGGMEELIRNTGS